VWKLKNGKEREEYIDMVRDRVEEKGNEQWQQMKTIMTETAQNTRGKSTGQCRHKETWWWND